MLINMIKTINLIYMKLSEMLRIGKEKNANELGGLL